MAVTHFAPNADAELLHQTLLNDGALIIDDLASTLPDGAAQLDVIQREMQPYIDATPVGGDSFTGKQTRRSGALIARSPASRPLVQHPRSMSGRRTKMLCQRSITWLCPKRVILI